MLFVILQELVSILGTFIAVLFMRYMLGLSSPRKDMIYLEYAIDDTVYRWKSGQFSSFVTWYRAKKLLDYEY